MKVDAASPTLKNKITLREDNYTSEQISTAYAKDCMLKCMCLSIKKLTGNLKSGKCSKKLTLAACPKGLDKQRTPRSDCF